MPGEGGDYFQRLQTEMSGLTNSRQSVALAESRRAELQRQLSGEDPFLFGIDPGAAQPSGRIAATSPSGSRRWKSRLEEMLLRYTEKHPEVIAVRSTIDELKKSQQEEIAERRPASAPPAAWLTR